MSAVISSDGIYRYHLRRFVPHRPTNGKLPRHMTFVMLNPSTADGDADDPTIRRCRGFAVRENCFRFDVVNLFAYRATKPDDLFDAHLRGINVRGPLNHQYVLEACDTADILVAAWGANIERFEKSGMPTLAALLRRYPKAMCLGKTKAGHPRHPLYVRKDQPLVPLVDSRREELWNG